ncbi:hypothetical protein SeW_A4768 [Salmonella enterica subsp. enterica serovar Weltevreden str. HI_N05-537]|nr:hypothetical protein SeW_A4768 [Salmonella enterica subsp. enterica serovar Weltevreden str. HI_N05-537]
MVMGVGVMSRRSMSEKGMTINNAVSIVFWRENFYVEIFCPISS